MSSNTGEKVWTTIWIICMAIAFWVLMEVVNTKAEQFDCQATVGCESAIIEQFPEGHGR
jgi:hypothetical protein